MAERVAPYNVAEIVGFEPTVEFNPYDGLANRCLKPLSHISVSSQDDDQVIDQTILYRATAYDN